MYNVFPLCELKEGQCATVMDILKENKIRRRLQDIGLIGGTEVKCVLKSQSGNPTAYFIRGATVAIRKSDAESVLVYTK